MPLNRELWVRGAAGVEQVQASPRQRREAALQRYVRQPVSHARCDENLMLRRRMLPHRILLPHLLASETSVIITKVPCRRTFYKGPLGEQA